MDAARGPRTVYLSIASTGQWARRGHHHTGTALRTGESATRSSPSTLAGDHGHRCQPVPAVAATHAARRGSESPSSSSHTKREHRVKLTGPPKHGSRSVQPTLGPLIESPRSTPPPKGTSEQHLPSSRVVSAGRDTPDRLPHGGLAERPKAHDWKSCWVNSPHGFESRILRSAGPRTPQRVRGPFARGSQLTSQLHRDAASRAPRARRRGDPSRQPRAPCGETTAEGPQKALARTLGRRMR